MCQNEESAVGQWKYVAYTVGGVVGMVRDGPLVPEKSGASRNVRKAGTYWSFSKAERDEASSHMAWTCTIGEEDAGASTPWGWGLDGELAGFRQGRLR